MSITSANSVFTLSISGLFASPQVLQGYAADDMYDTDVMKSAEAVMGCDGQLSGGFVFVPVTQHISLQADSPSIFIFDQWWASSQQIKDVYTANGIILQPSLGRKLTLTKGFLTGYPPVSDAKRILQPRKFEVMWQMVVPSNTSGAGA